MKRGFSIYGVIGIALIILVEINFFLKIEPLASWYFPIIWLGYILTIDSIVYKLKGNSLISNRAYSILGMFVISSLFWWIFEFTNISLNNWSYSGVGAFQDVKLKNLFGTIAFSTVLPALFETLEAIRAIGLFETSRFVFAQSPYFSSRVSKSNLDGAQEPRTRAGIYSGVLDKKKLKKKHNVTKPFLLIMVLLGIVSFILPVFLPKFTFPLVWLSFFFFLDPINYLHKQPSVIGHLKDRKLTIPFSLLLAGITLGFLWEFWNYWAVPRWTYDIPFVGFFKLFEMPVLGYFGYFPFAFELYSMYWFIRSLFLKKELALVG